MSDEKVLTKEITQYFLEDEDSVDPSEFTMVADAAAESLSKHEGNASLDLDKLPDSAAEILRQHSPFTDDV